MKDPRDTEINEMLRRTSEKMKVRGNGSNIITNLLDSLIESMEEMDKEENGPEIPQGS